MAKITALKSVRPPASENNIVNNNLGIISFTLSTEVLLMYKFGKKSRKRINGGASLSTEF